MKARILEELSYTNLTTSRLAAILDIKVSDLKEELSQLEEAKTVRLIEKGGDKMWELT